MKFRIEKGHRYVGEVFPSWQGTGVPAFYCRVQVLDDGGDYEIHCLFLGKELSHKAHYETDSMTTLIIEGYLDNYDGKVILRATDLIVGGKA